MICRQLPLNSLCSFVRTFTLVVVYSSSFRIEEFFHRMAIPLRSSLVKQNNHCLLTNCTNSARSPHYFFSFLGILTDPLFLKSTVPFGRPSASLGSLYSLIPPHFACCCPIHNFRRRSFFMWVLSHSDTLNLNG